MGSNLVIAAIPDENDPVWKVSSEKIPHLTLLFLGEADAVSNLDQIMLFVEHAARTSLKRFYLPVDRRGELGDDKADVLFFKKNRYDFKAVRDFRSTLLQDQNIKTAYDSAEQFDGPWNPHLTLGYPETPAKPVGDGQISSFYSVDFNKIAVWTGDFEGPDWLLKDYWDEMDEMMDSVPMDVAMSDIEHHGVKGQKWGVRKVEGGGDKAHIRINQKTGQAALSTQSTVAIVVPALTFAPLTPLAFLSPRVRAEVKAARTVNKGIHEQKKIAKADKKFEKNAQSAKNFVEIHNGAQDQINKHIADVNKKYPQDLTKDPKAQKQYDDEITKGLQAAYRTSANQLGNKTGTRHLDLEFHNDGLDFKIVAKEGMQTPTPERVVHAAVDDSSVEFTGKIKRDATGHIVGFEFDDFEPQSMTQTVDMGMEFLEHHGVKGMKWGVRKSDVGNAAKIGVKTVGRGVKKTGKGLVTLGKNVAFESEGQKQRKTKQVHRAATEKFTKHDLPRINAKYKDTQAATLKGRLKNPLNSDTRAYRSESRIAYRDRVNEAVNALPTNSSGKRKYEIEDSGKTNAQYGWTLKVVDVKKTVQHAEDVGLLDEFAVQPVFDADGFITDVRMVESTLAQSTDFDSELDRKVDLGAEFLEHYGIKGMHWGVRRAGAVTTRAHIDSGIVRRQTRIQTRGGEAHPPTHDAINAAISKQKLKKSGTAALSNKELKDLQTRLQLEIQVQQLTTSKGKKVVARQLEEEGKQQLSKGIRKGAPIAIKKASKSAATAAVTTALL